MTIVPKFGLIVAHTVGNQDKFIFNQMVLDTWVTLIRRLQILIIGLELQRDLGQFLKARNDQMSSNLE